MNRSGKYTQMPNSRKSIHADKMRKAKKVGWRVSDSGNIYFENRQNRSDKKNKL